MQVSVVVPTYNEERYPDFCECVDSLLSQTYDDVEVVVVVDGNETVTSRAKADYGDHENVILYNLAPNAGPLSMTNMGVVLASGDVVANTDDDAVPAEDWVEKLVDVYERRDAIAVGGPIDPEWVAPDPGYIPEEFYFLIGASHRGTPETEREVRNTFGANLSFKRDAYMKLGGIKIGGIDPSEVQGRETEFCARLRQHYGKGVVFTPDARVRHKIYEYRTEKDWLLRRAFWQGYSKRAMANLVPGESDDEAEFVRNIFLRYLPDRMWGALTRRSENATEKFLMLIVLIVATGLGYLWGLIRWR
jgi:glycosyltransferase involved in cell wall biosynthesis